jgi:hypothetical protein
VWFFRNERGGCAYFDAVGAPWPKHPCMDSPGRFDEDAGWQARQAFERAQAKAAKRAQRMALAEERRRQRVATRTAGASHQAPTPGTTSSLAVSSSGDVPEAGERKRWALGWWTAFAMLLAWLGSLPFTGAVYGDLGDSGLWAMHLLVGMPTVVSLLALLWFLFTVPTPRPTVRRVGGALLLAPLFLLGGMLVFLFTAGLGSLGFAWFLWWQGRPPSRLKSGPSSSQAA